MNQSSEADENAKMRRAGVVGWPVAHSRSPLIHHHWLETFGIDGHYDRYPIKPEDDFERELRALVAAGLCGVNVTIPYKEKAFALADTASDAARHLGAANVLRFSDGSIHADNTDGYGFLAHLRSAASDRDWVNGPICVLGAGGAARAVVVSLAEAGARDVRIINRSPTRAQSLLPLLAAFGVTPQIFSFDDVDEALMGCGLLVNTTSLGMAGQPDLDFDVALLSSHMSSQAVVYDIVYVPLETKLLAAARACGLHAVDGLGMLLHQAVPAFEMWFGPRPNVTPELRAALVADLHKDH